MRPEDASIRSLASHEVEDATESAVWVAAAGFEFDRGSGPQLLGVARVQFGPAQIQSVDEQPHSVPPQRVHAALSETLTEFLGRVGPGR